MLIRSLTTTDAALYQPLRLRALREHPEAFAPAFEEEQQLPLETIANRLQQEILTLKFGVARGDEIELQRDAVIQSALKKLRGAP